MWQGDLKKLNHKLNNDAAGSFPTAARTQSLHVLQSITDQILIYRLFATITQQEEPFRGRTSRNQTLLSWSIYLGAKALPWGALWAIRRPKIEKHDCFW